MEYIIETKNLLKRYGAKAAVNNVSLHVKKGEIYGLIGKNGAGKTTLMKLLLGLANPNSGEISLFGSSTPNEKRRKIGSLIEEPALYKGETALENLRRFAILVPTPEEELQRLLELVGLSDAGNKKAGKFSLGMRQRLGIAQAIMEDPSLLILDEPMNGLDKNSVAEMRELFRSLATDGRTILLASHNIADIDALCDTVCEMDAGVMTMIREERA